MILNTNTNKFSQAAIPGGPRARDSHSCVIVRDRLYVWGGCKNKQVNFGLFRPAMTATAFSATRGN
jgi:hypothetical protein